jgi:hypothetical protein
MDLQEVGWGVMNWFTLAQDRKNWHAVVKVVMAFGNLTDGKLSAIGHILTRWAK